MSRKLLWAFVLCTTLMAGFQGCRSLTPSVTYYVISPMTAGSVSVADTDGSRAMTVGIRAVELPGYVNRTQMVKRAGQNQLEIASFHHWADYPDRMVQRVIGENLQLLMADAQVYSAPWPTGLKPDVTVDVTFLELIGTTDQAMLLSAVWTFTGKSDPAAAQFHRTALTEPMPASRFDDLAAAHSRVLEILCRKVAESLYAF